MFSLNKRVSAFVLGVLICFGIGYGAAEEIDRDIFLNAAVEIQTWGAKLASIYEQLEDADSRALIEISVSPLSNAVSVLVDATHPENDIKEKVIGELVCSLPYSATEADIHYANSGTRKIENVNYLFECNNEYREKYLRLGMNIYTNAGELVGILDFEIGERDDIIVFLMIDYDHQMNMTGRYAMKIEGGEPLIVFTKTFGKTLDIVLDVDTWQSGEEIVWGKDLLLPAAVLYQE